MKHATPLTRRPSSRANVIKSTYEPAELKKAFAGQDAVISLVGSMNIGTQKDIINTAAESGIKWFIPSEFGSDTTNPELLKLVPIFGDKVAAVEQLRAKESSGMSWTAMITGAFFDFCLKAGFYEIDVPKREARVYDSGDVKFDTATLPHIGEALVTLVTSPALLEKYKNRYVAISSLKTSQNEMIASIEKALGVTFKRENVDAAAVGKEAQESLSKGDFSMEVFRSLIMSPVLGKGLADHEKSPGLNNDDLLPGPLPSLDEQVKITLKEMGQL